MFISTAWSGIESIYLSAALILMLFVLFWIARKAKRFRTPFILITMVINAVYLAWRIGYTLPLRYGVISAVLGILLLLAEIMGYFQSVVYRSLFLKPTNIVQHTLAEWPEPPAVDVLIATYNESKAILLKTITACLNLDYPTEKINIYLCDDGRRAEARALCEELGVHYITRDDNKHAKAGNINNALAQTNGEFIVLLDADMLPKSNFLQKTIGYFMDPQLGFVQTPQVFYNPDPFQFNLHLNYKIPNEQDLFMLDIQAARSNYNAVLHVGTNAVFRRSALDAIGGVPTGTITEDMATGMLIQAKGYRTLFLRDVLCVGLSVESFRDLIRQRDRWCRGNIQVSKKWNPLTVKGLTLVQRIIYLDGMVYWFFGVQKLIYLICPLIYLIFGTIILTASPEMLLVFWLPSFLASILSNQILNPRSRSVAWSHIYEVAMAPYLALAALSEALFSKPLPFRVTPKGFSTEKTTFSLGMAAPHLVMFGLTLAGWTAGALQLAAGIENVYSFGINLAWSVYNAFAIFTSILVCVERPRKRVAERIDADEQPMLIDIECDTACKIEDLSETGVRIECGHIDNARQAGDTVHLTFKNIGEIEGRVAWRKSLGQKTFVGIAFTNYSQQTYRNLQKYLNDQNKGYHENDTLQ